MELKGKTVLITGAARRIGRVSALSIAARGADLIIHYRSSKQEAEATVREIEKSGARAASVSGDLSSAAGSESVVRRAAEIFGRLDVLVNNASAFYKTPLASVTEKEWDDLIDTNLKGPFFCAKAAAIEMARGKRNETLHGKIVNIADWAGFKPYTDYLPYCISKGGLIAMTVGLARTLAPKITVNAIAPGPVMLPEGMPEEELAEAKRKTPLKRFGAPEDVANAILFLLVGSDFVTGATIVVDGGRLIG